MELEVTEGFRQLCRSIEAEGRTLEEWSAIESDDMFQVESFEGGFDAIEDAFCFSFYDDDGSEWWFQVTLEEVRQIAGGELERLDARPAE